MCDWGFIEWFILTLVVFVVLLVIVVIFFDDDDFTGGGTGRTGDSYIIMAGTAAVTSF